jgi:Fe-S cluster biogenesis protein NfuA
MATLNEVLERLGQLLAEIEQLDESVREPVLELLDGIEALHRSALERLPDALGADGIERLRAADPALGWLLDTYGISGDERAAADRALDSVRPYIASHGGAVEVLEVSEGVVHVRLTGACAGCAGSAITLREGVEAALRAGMPAFQRLEVAPDDAPAHPPPGPTLLQIENLVPQPAIVVKQHGA